MAEKIIKSDVSVSGNQIKNVGNGEDATDVLTKQQIENLLNSLAVVNDFLKFSVGNGVDLDEINYWKRISPALLQVDSDVVIGSNEIATYSGRILAIHSASGSAARLKFTTQASGQGLQNGFSFNFNSYGLQDFEFINTQIGGGQGFYTSQVRRLYITGSGLIAIGNNFLPTEQLDVNGRIRQRLISNYPSSDKIAVFGETNDDVIGYRSLSSMLAWAEEGTDVARATGKVLIGQTASNNNAKVQITDNSQQLSIGQTLFESIAAASLQANGAMTIGSLTDILYAYATQHIWKTGTSERMRLSAAGDLLLGTSLTGFNTKLVIQPAFFQSSLLAYLNPNREDAINFRIGSKSLFRISTNIQRILHLGEKDENNLLEINMPSLEYEHSDIHAHSNDFSPAGVTQGEIYERRNAAHYRNGSGTNLTHLNITTDAVNHSSARFIMHIEGQMNDLPLDVKLIINQNDYSVIEYGNNAKPTGLNFVAGLDGNSNIYVQSTGVGISFIFSCLSVHMRKHSRHDSSNPIPKITNLLVNDGTSTQ